MKINTYPLLLLLCLVISPANANTLTNEQQADGYLLEAQQAYKSGDYSNAVSAFEKIENLNVKMVDDFHFFYAMAASKSYRKQKAWKEVNIYLKATGRNGTYYQKALSLYQSLRPVVASSANSEIAKVEEKIQEWNKVSSQQSLRQTISPWLKTEKEKARKFAEQNKFEDSIKTSRNAIIKADRYIHDVNSRAANLNLYHKNYKKLEEATKLGLIDKNILPPHITSNKSLSNALRDLDFKDFDLTYTVATKKMKKDLPKANNAFASLERKHSIQVSKLKKKMKCMALESEVNGYKGLQITYKNSLSALESEYRNKCGA